MSLKQCLQKQRKTGNKRMREKDIVDSVIVRGQQNFDENFETLNATDIRLEDNQFLYHFQIYKLITRIILIMQM